MITVVNPCRRDLTLFASRGVRIAYGFNPFPPSDPGWDLQLRLFAHFTPQPRHYGTLPTNCGNHKSMKINRQHNKVGPVLEPYQILGTRSIMRGDHVVSQYHVQWGHDGLIDDSWEDDAHFLKMFPEFNLEDKVAVDERNNDIDTYRANRMHEEVNVASQNEEAVTNKGHVAANPHFQGLRRSKRERINNQRLKELGD
ncbi:hypothetical protein PIB30_005207 [Stylosanthes scabra]|uniref:Chromo domain-containing protein n=1 Tax=Stylosanthes scabra TaxID=79078 RepID=A0ABU6S4C5_9FABA|nr:hypothetical protein [Stylosanthes scabra]